MKYRVKYKCYWYNTGLADNHYYIENKDFDTIGEAESFKKRVDEQFEVGNEWGSNKMEYSKYSNWQKSFDSIEVENGFIAGYGEIFKFYPEIEEKLNLRKEGDMS